MGTLRHDRVRLWGDPRVSEAQIVESLESFESSTVGLRPEADGGSPASSRVMTLLGLAGASMVAAAGSRLFGLSRLARMFAYLAPPLLLLAFYEGSARARA